MTSNPIERFNRLFDDAKDRNDFDRMSRINEAWDKAVVTVYTQMDGSSDDDKHIAAEALSILRREWRA